MCRNLKSRTTTTIAAGEGLLRVKGMYKSNYQYVQGMYKKYYCQCSITLSFECGVVHAGYD